MSLKIGIVGLPNVGKSTLFAAVTKKQVPAENYPFCTIDPNVGTVAVPDARLDTLSTMSHSTKVINTTIEFVDIAGLVKGASTGEGLGNQFLSHIRECDAIAHVVRHFQDGDVIHVSGKVSPVDDRTVIETELALADLQVVDKALQRLEKENKAGVTPERTAQIETLQKAKALLNEGKAVRNLEVSEKALPFWNQLQLITAKPMMYVHNVDEKEVKQEVMEYEGCPVVDVSAKIEAEIAQLPAADAKAFLADLGWQSSGLDRVIVAAYKLLGLLTYITTGEMETRAWTIHRGTKAPEAAGEIHTDFIKGFIRAEIVSYEDLVKAGSWSAARDNGTLRTEGKEYVMKDGDVVNFLVNQ